MRREMSGKITCEGCGIESHDFFENESDGSVYNTYDEFRDTVLMINSDDGENTNWYCTKECFDNDLGSNPTI
jgi:hypothetical protein